MDKNWIYYGAFFDENTRSTLINKAKRLTEIPSDWTLYADHMTIIYNDKSDEKQRQAEGLSAEIGNPLQLHISSIGISDEAIAFGIDNFHSQNEHSHVTIAVAPNSKPVKSNEIKEWLPIDGFYVIGTVNLKSKRK